LTSIFSALRSKINTRVSRPTSGSRLRPRNRRLRIASSKSSRQSVRSADRSVLRRFTRDVRESEKSEMLERLSVRFEGNRGAKNWRSARLRRKDASLKGSSRRKRKS